MQAVIPNNRHWSPSPYGGVKDGNSTTVTWNYGTASGRDGIGEVDVESRRIIKVSFSEPVRQCVGTATCGPLTSSSLYLTDTSGAIVKALVDQIDDTTWALFPYESEDNGSTLGDGFLSRKTYVAHVVPANIKDFDGMLMANNSSSAANGASEVTKKNEYTWAFTVK